MIFFSLFFFYFKICENNSYSFLYKKKTVCFFSTKLFPKNKSETTLEIFKNEFSKIVLFFIKLFPNNNNETTLQFFKNIFFV